jgi:FHS family L-fucose permease-like MFS transporter
MVSAVKQTRANHSRVILSKQKNTLAIGVVSTLFFLFGFITCLNDILIPHLKEVFSLTYTESMLVQFTFFGAYFLISWPASKMISQYGYKISFITGLALTAVGCLFFIFAAKISIYAFFLIGLFVLASGIVVLQVAANPYLTLLGDPQKASSRLIFAQGLNSLGTTIAPLIGSIFILSVAVKTADDISKFSANELHAYQLLQASAVQLPYLGLALFIGVIAFVLARISFPSFPISSPEHSLKLYPESLQKDFRFFDYPQLVFGTLAIFAYVGAEVAIGSIMVNFIAHSSIGNISLEKAGYYLPLYWGGAMVGRFVGSYLTTKFKPARVLLIHAVMASVLVLCTILGTGSFALYSIVAVGLFNSIMFPVIFVLSTQNLGAYVEKASGILCMAIVGGAIIPLIQGVVADFVNLNLSYLVPLVCYIYIAVFAFRFTRKDFLLQKEEK